MPKQYTVMLENFEGPLDLLLSLIERRELDITEVSVSQVTTDYLSYITALEQVAERELVWFVDVAVRILLHKSKALGAEPIDQAEVAEEASFAQLTEQLQLLKMYRQVSQILAAKWLGQIGRGSNSVWLKQLPPPNLNAMAIQQAGMAISSRTDQSSPALKRRPVIISRQDISATMRRLVNDITEPARINLLFAGQNRKTTIILLLAILELIKQGELNIKWHEDEIYVYS